MGGERASTGATPRQDAARIGAGFRALAVRLQRAAFASPIAALSFWIAIVLPLLYVPLLLFGFPTSRGFTVFLALVALHLVTLSLGHAYRN